MLLLYAQIRHAMQLFAKYLLPLVIITAHLQITRMNVFINKDHCCRCATVC